MRARETMTVLLTVLASGGAVAQDDPWSGLEAVDQGVADVSPLSESLRLEPIDMRVSDGFSRVYRLEGVNGWDDQYARRDGAITAVFPRSVYLPAAYGGGVAIPAGTVFLIGAPPAWVRERFDLGGDAPGAPGLAVEPVDARMAIDAVDTAAPPTPYATGRTIPATGAERATLERPATPWTTDHRRGARVSSLLSLAAAAD